MPEGPNHSDVIVIGGGFAGVTAARDLTQDGYSVVLLEARDRLGGRTYYREFGDTGQKVEFGGTWLGPDTPAVRHIHDEVRRYDIPLTTSPVPRSATAFVGGRRIDGMIPIPPEQIMEFERGLHTVAAASRRIDQHRPLGSQALDLDIPCDRWLADLDLPRESLDVFHAFVQIYFGCIAAEVSALHVLGQIAALGYSGLAMFLVLDAKFANGTISLINAIIGDSTADVRLESAVSRVSQDRTGVEVTTQTGDRFTAAACVVAVPLNCWDDIEFAPVLSGAKRIAGSERHAGHAFKPWALVQNLPDDYFLGLGMAPDLNWISTEFVLPEGSLMCGFGPSTPRIDQSDPRSIEALVRAYAPEAHVVAVDSHDWDVDPYSNGAYTALRPGWLARYGRELRAPEGRLAFASSDIADGPSLGFMSGAIQRGGAAATEIAAILRTRAAKTPTRQSRSARNRPVHA
jgi:monoamine oxidase